MSPATGYRVEKTEEISRVGLALHEYATIIHVMSVIPRIPDDPEQCQRLLDDRFRPTRTSAQGIALASANLSRPSPPQPHRARPARGRKNLLLLRWRETSHRRGPLP